MFKLKVLGKTLTIKIKYADFTLQTRSKSLAFHTDTVEIMSQTVIELLRNPEVPTKPIRLLGVGINNLEFPKENKAANQLTIDF